ncbi:hypothetical protein A6U87_19245 [Rhizobium sp. AC44/96]|nr:hypothetical protein A6U87_19245 [Rhizobium sp. AC44/96]
MIVIGSTPRDIGVVAPELGLIKPDIADHLSFPVSVDVAVSTAINLCHFRLTDRCQNDVSLSGLAIDIKRLREGSSRDWQAPYGLLFSIILVRQRSSVDLPDPGRDRKHEAGLPC